MSFSPWKRHCVQATICQLSNLLYPHILCAFGRIKTHSASILTQQLFLSAPQTWVGMYTNGRLFIDLMHVLRAFDPRSHPHPHLYLDGTEIYLENITQLTNVYELYRSSPIRKVMHASYVLMWTNPRNASTVTATYLTYYFAKYLRTVMHNDTHKGIHTLYTFYFNNLWSFVYIHTVRHGNQRNSVSDIHKRKIFYNTIFNS